VAWNRLLSDMEPCRYNDYSRTPNLAVTAVKGWIQNPQKFKIWSISRHVGSFCRALGRQYILINVKFGSRQCSKFYLDRWRGTRSMVIPVLERRVGDAQVFYSFYNSLTIIIITRKMCAKHAVCSTKSQYIVYRLCLSLLCDDQVKFVKWSFLPRRFSWVDN